MIIKGTFHSSFITNLEEYVLGKYVIICVPTVDIFLHTNWHFWRLSSFRQVTYKVPSRVTHAGIQVPVVGRVGGASDTLSVNAHKAILAEAAAFVEVFVIATYWSCDFIAWLSGGIISLTPGANTTHASDTNVAKQTHARLSVTRVLLISATLN